MLDSTRENKEGIEKEYIFIFFLYFHSAMSFFASFLILLFFSRINNGLFLMSRTWHMLMLMLFHLNFFIPSISHPIFLSVDFKYTFIYCEMNELFCVILYSVYVVCEWLDGGAAMGGQTFILHFFFFFWCVIREENCNLNLNNVFFFCAAATAVAICHPFNEGINIEQNVYMHEENGQKKLYIYICASRWHMTVQMWIEEKNLLLVYWFFMSFSFVRRR